MVLSTSAYLHAVLSISHTTAVCGVLTIIAGMFWMLQNQYRLPPGPPLYLPGLGHLMKLASNPLMAFRSLRRTYGDVFKIYMGTRLAVVLNGYDVINEVLMTRGPEFSHRPPSFLAEKLAQNKGLLNTSGKVWMEQKSNVMKSLRSLACHGGYLDLQIEAEVNRLCQKLTDLADEGQSGRVNLSHYIRKSMCSIAFFLVFGRVLDYDSKELALYSDSMEELFGYLGSLAVVNFIPYAHMLPGDPVCYHRCLEVVRIIENDLIKPEIRRIIQLRSTGGVDSNDNIQNDEHIFNGHTPTCSLVGGYIEDMERKKIKNIHTEMNEEHLVKAAGDLMAGGYDTVSNTLQWLVIYLIHHPDVQDRCRKEVSQAMSNCGGRIIDISRSDLVYTQATIMEVQRLANVGPFPPVHCCDHDTTIQGYDIPKDTIIMTNLDSLMMGPHVGDNPEEFRPDRFVSDEGKLVQPKWFMPYATGSRMCIGASVAKKELLFVAVGLLSRFKFAASVIDNQTQEPSLQGDLGLTNVPKPFTVSLKVIDS